MERAYRIAIQSIYAADAFWVQAGVIIEQYARQHHVNLITLDIGIDELDEANYLRIVEDLVTQEIAAFIIQDLPAPLVKLLIEHNIPVISLNEQPNCDEAKCVHLNFSAPLGLAGVAQIMAEYIAGQLGGQGEVLVIGGLSRAGGNDDGRSRLARIFSILAPYSKIKVTHIPSLWPYDEAYPQIVDCMRKLKVTPDAIIGLSDTLAMAGRAAARELKLLTPRTITGGINAEPKAVAAILEGEMTATVEISVLDFGREVVKLALKAASGQPLPRHFNYLPRLITKENAPEVAASNLITVADLPNLLLGVNRRQEQQRMIQLETSLAINRQIGTILDPHQLNRTIVNLIRSNYNFDRVQLYLWSETEQALLLDDLAEAGSKDSRVSHRPEANTGEVLKSVFTSREMTFVPDMYNSQRFQPDKDWAELRSRVVLPVRLGENVLGVLDLQCDTIKHFSMEQLMGLQLLADQLAIAISNARLYNEALEARRAAEKSDKLKTLLLANVSHEFRTPLNIILGYTQSLLKGQIREGGGSTSQQVKDLQHIYSSGEHLVRLVNDLLDLSRAEIDELEIFPEIIDVRLVLAEVLQNMADLTTPSIPTGLAGSAHSSERVGDWSSEGGSLISWRLTVPPRLPLLQADPVRLRQMLLNLLSNAYKFTRRGEITLGAEVALPDLHFWVKDSGRGVPADQQDQIFEPFVVGEPASPESNGIGLGLSITRRLVNLHRGRISVESNPDQGSTFHIYLPLPSLNGSWPVSPPEGPQSVLYLSNSAVIPAEIKQLATRSGFELCPLQPSEVRHRQTLANLQPAVLVWDSDHVTAADWSAVDILRAHPHFARLPFVLFNKGEGTTSTEPAGLTNILLKPFNNQTLETALESLRPAQSEGAILIVDDDARAIRLYEDLVTTTLPGYTVYQASDGQQALNLLKTLVPALVILDLTMPEVDGFAVIEWLRSNPATRKTPILVVSGRVLDAEALQKLDHQRVVFNGKQILNKTEAADILMKISKTGPILPQHNSLLVKRAITFIQKNYTKPISLTEIAGEFGISKNYLGEIFQLEAGISPWEYLNRYRINQAKHLLRGTDLSIGTIAGEVGFDDPSYFSRVFRALTGQTPKTFRKIE